MREKKYCDRCKRIDEECGVICSVSTTRFDLSMGSKCELFEYPIKDNLIRRNFRRFMQEGFDICENCLFEFMGYLLPLKNETESTPPMKEESTAELLANIEGVK